MANPLITDYASLQLALSDWSWRANDTAFAANLPQFIDHFERKFKRTRRTLEMQTNVTGSVTIGTTATVPIPSDYLEAIVLMLTGLSGGTPNQELTYVTPQRARELNTTTQPSGTPKWFTILEGNFVVVPSSWVPSGATYSLDYYGFAQLSASNTTNWLIAKHPDIYLYGALMQGIAYIDDKETVAFWKTGLEEALAELDIADQKAKTGSGPLVMTPSMAFRTQRQRIPVPGV